MCIFTYRYTCVLGYQGHRAVKGHICVYLRMNIHVTCVYARMNMHVCVGWEGEVNLYICMCTSNTCICRMGR
jgi:hypothetical protein